MRDVLDQWIRDGRPELPLEVSRPTDLEGYSFLVAEEHVEALDDYSIGRSSAVVFVDKSSVVRVLLDAWLAERAGAVSGRSGEDLDLISFS